MAKRPQGTFIPTVEIDRKSIDEIFAIFDCSDLPGVAVGIAVGGNPVYANAFGLANMELPARLTTSMRMRIGSTSKHFTALAWLLLCEEGRAKLDESIRSYLPELPPIADPVTVRQLLANVGGLRDGYDICYQFSGTGRAVSTCDVLNLCCGISDRNAEPDSTWIYSNSGFMLVATAIERLEDRTFEEVLKDRIFDPAALSSTMLRRWDDGFVPNSATLHMVDTAGGFTKSYLGTASAGQGGIVSSIDDLLHWLAQMGQPLVGSAASWALLTTPHRLRNGTSTGYGLGLMSGQYRGLDILHHGGGVMGGSCQMLKAPALNLDVVVLSNRHDVASVGLGYRILDSIVSGLTPVSHSDAAVASGWFRSEASQRTIGLSRKGAQAIATIDGSDYAIARGHDGLYRPVPELAYNKFEIDVDAAAHRLHLREFGNLDDFEAVEGRSIAPDFAGRFRSDETGTELSITIDSDGFTLSSLGRFGSMEYRLEPITRTVARARSTTVMPLGGIFTLQDDGRTLHFSSSMTRQLPFRRTQ